VPWISERSFSPPPPGRCAGLPPLRSCGASLGRSKPGSPRRRPVAASGFSSRGRRASKGGSRSLSTKPQTNLEPRRAPAHGRRAEEALGRCLERHGCGGVGAGACEGRQEKAPPHPRGARADQRGGEAAVGGAEEGQTVKLGARPRNHGRRSHHGGRLAGRRRR
jgi:hypothetical protein